MQLQTVGGIACQTGYTTRQVRYVVKTRTIAEVLRLGEHGAQIFDQPAIGRIIQELDTIAIRKIPVTPVRKNSRGRHE